MIASYLGAGVVAAMFNAQVLYLLPVSLFGMAVSAAELPEMSSATGGERARAEHLQKRLAPALRRVVFLVVPSAIAFIAIGGSIVALLFQTGRFGAHDTRVVWIILAGSALGLSAGTQGRLLGSAFYALGDPTPPLRAALVRVAITGVTGWVFALPLRHALGYGVEWGAFGLTASAGFAAWVEFLLLKRWLERRIGKVAIPTQARARCARRRDRRRCRGLRRVVRRGRARGADLALGRPRDRRVRRDLPRRDGRGEGARGGRLRPAVDAPASSLVTRPRRIQPRDRAWRRTSPRDGRRGVRRVPAVEEALCFGATRYSHRFTPRRAGSAWSPSNLRRVAALAAAGKLHPARQAVIDAAKRSGAWSKPTRVPMPAELAAALTRAAAARRTYENLTPSQQRQWRRWIGQAKRAETRARRAAKAVAQLAAGHQNPWQA